MILLGVFLGTVFCFMDIMIDVYIFNYGDLLDQLLRPEKHELYMRLSLVVLSIFFGIFAHILLKRQQASTERANKSERFVNSIIDNIPGMIFIKDAEDLCFVRINEYGNRLLGLPNSELIGKNDYDFFPKQQADYFTRMDREVLASGTGKDISEEEIDTKYLGKRLLHTKKVSVPDENGQPAFLLGLSQDINRYRYGDEETALEFASEGCLALTGYSIDDFVRGGGISLIDLAHPDDRESVAETIHNAIHAQRPFKLTYRIITASAGEKWVWEQGQPVFDEGNVPHIEGFITDITDTKHAELALQKSEARLQTLFDSAAEFIFVIDSEGVINMVNRYAISQSGYSENEILGKNIKAFFTEQSQYICDCNFPGLREQGYNRANIEFVHKDGHVIQMECSATAIPNENAEFTSFLIIQRDITERLQAAAALEDSERRFRAIFNSTFQFIGLLDPDGTVLEANQAALEFGGLAPEDVVGRPPVSLRNALRDAAHGMLVRYEVSVTGKANEVRIFDFSLKPVMNDKGETILIIPEGRDITELKKIEEEAKHHQLEAAHVMRLSTMGEMASGMAHELNQPLTAVISYCETAESLLEALPSPSPDLADILKRCKEQALRAGNIIHHLRELVSREQRSRKPVDLDQTIRDVMRFLAWELRDSNAKVELRLFSQGHKIMADTVQIEQVLINLIRNSLEAIKAASTDQGVIELQTVILPDGQLELTVTDNGPGIDPVINGKIFEPFQTTKASGMGMGLSISHSIIESHDGKLRVDENRKDGASIGFTLPVCD
jgi:PAS domain S-box-containing protein